MTNIKDSAKVPEGKTLGLLLSVIDLGDHEKTYDGKTQLKPVVRLSFELPNHKGEDGKPMIVNKELPVFAYEKANIAKYFAALGITPDKESNDVKDMIRQLGDKIGAPVELEIGINQFAKQEDGQELTIRYNEIKSIVAPQPGGTHPALVNSRFFYLQGYSDDSLLNELPDFIQAKIKLRETIAVTSPLDEEDSELPF